MLSPFQNLSDQKATSLRIERLPRGGYVVSKHAGQAYMQDQLFACTDIDDALGFIKDELGEPEKVDDGISATALKVRMQAEEGPSFEDGIKARKYGGIV